MGVYAYTIRKKSIKATLLPDNKKVTVAMATYLCKDLNAVLDKHDPHHEYFARQRSIVTKAQGLIAAGFTADLIAIDKFEGDVYEFKPLYVFEDTPAYPFDKKGFLMKYNMESIILPFEKDGTVDFKKYLPAGAWDGVLPRGGMHVKMNNHYTATVYRLQSLEDYLFAPDADLFVDVNILDVTNTNEGTPFWFQVAVRQMVQKKMRLSPNYK
jgi:hypothetical protein